MKLRACRRRSASMLGSEVSPSSPQFQLRLLVSAVAIVLAVSQVVLVIVADQIPEREPVMTGYKINAAGRQAMLVGIKIAAAGQTGCDFAYQATVATNEAPDDIAIAAIPLRPARTGKRAYLIQASRVPRLGDKGCLGEGV